MQVGIAGSNLAFFAEREHALALARTAEAAGVESLWTYEHVVVPAGHESTYPYSPDGKMPGDGLAPLTDPLAWLAFVSAVTDTIKLATGIPDPDTVKRYEDLGVSRIVVDVPTYFPKELDAAFGKLHDDLISKLS